MAISAAGNSFGTRDKLNVGAQTFEIHRLDSLGKEATGNLAKLPFSLAHSCWKILLRCEDGRFVQPADIRALAEWTPGGPAKRNCVHARARAAAGFYRRARHRRFGDDARSHQAHGRQSHVINPLFPAELVIDHSVQVDSFGNNPRRLI